MARFGQHVKEIVVFTIIILDIDIIIKVVIIIIIIRKQRKEILNRQYSMYMYTCF